MFSWKYILALSLNLVKNSGLGISGGKKKTAPFGIADLFLRGEKKTGRNHTPMAMKESDAYCINRPSTQEVKSPTVKSWVQQEHSKTTT